jgi:hypothetical protein
MGSEQDARTTTRRQKSEGRGQKAISLMVAVFKELTTEKIVVKQFFHSVCFKNVF